MIGRIKGILQEKKPPHLLIDVGGVGYEVAAPMTTCYHLPELGQSVCLFTHFVVREDAQQLYGFAKSQERDLFRTLIKVNNIGPKVALAILSGVEPDQFVRCVLDNDTVSLCRLPGIGKKTAERLVIEMRDRLSDWHPINVENTNANSGATLSANTIMQEAINALIALGYKPQEASRSISRVNQPGMSSEELIRLALKNMVGTT